jgi:GNAT superfamily N-acetyltransferase
VSGVISLSIYSIFWFKIWYVDDFIVHKRLRWKWYGQQLFDKTQQQAQAERCDYLLLFSQKKRKASHRFYKKAWLTIMSLGVGIMAYKKYNNKK